MVLCPSCGSDWTPDAILRFHVCRCRGCLWGPTQVDFSVWCGRADVPRLSSGSIMAGTVVAKFGWVSGDVLWLKRFVGRQPDGTSYEDVDPETLSLDEAVAIMCVSDVLSS